MLGSEKRCVTALAADHQSEKASSRSTSIAPGVRRIVRSSHAVIVPSGPSHPTDTLDPAEPDRPRRPADFARVRRSRIGKPATPTTISTADTPSHTKRFHSSSPARGGTRSLRSATVQPIENWADAMLPNGSSIAAVANTSCWSTSCPSIMRTVIHAETSVTAAPYAAAWLCVRDATANATADTSRKFGMMNVDAAEM